MDTPKPGYWAVIPAEVRYDPELPLQARLLYAEISALTDLQGYCFATNAYLANLYQISDRTLQRNLRALENRGYIRIEDGNGGRGRRKIYAGINPLSGNPDKNVMVPNNPDKNVGVTPTKMSGSIDNNIIYQDPPKAPQGAGVKIHDPEAFDRFWALYPKKKDKQKAIKEWNKLKADRKLMREMSAALGRQMASEEWQRDNGRAIPYPCRWLSHRRWEDDLSVSLPVPQRREEARPEWI